jgi:replicative DNA helicase
VWIDHVLLIAKPSMGRNANDAASWSVLSRGIKRLAQELRICIINLIQLNRQGAEGEPRLQDLKESGAWEEDANAVWMLWPKESMAQDTMAERKGVWVKAAKNRSGPSGWKRELQFHGATNRFLEVEHTTEPFNNSQAKTGRRPL